MMTVPSLDDLADKFPLNAAHVSPLQSLFTNWLRVAFPLYA